MVAAPVVEDREAEQAHPERRLPARPARHEIDEAQCQHKDDDDDERTDREVAARGLERPVGDEAAERVPERRRDDDPDQADDDHVDEERDRPMGSVGQQLPGRSRCALGRPQRAREGARRRDGRIDHRGDLGLDIRR